MLETQLGKLGLSKNEIKIYLALFELGKCKAKKIIDYTGLHRNLVYTALEELVGRGLVSKVEKQNVLHFEANNPKALLEIISLQKSIAEDAIEELKKKQNNQPKEIVVYEGEDGIKRSRNKTLSYPAGETLYVIGSKASSTPGMEIYWRKFHREREKKKINFKMMYEHGVSPADMDWRNQLELSKAKYLPFQIDLPVWFAFISDYLEIGIPGSDPLTFSMRNKQVAGAFKKFFDFFWNQESYVLKGPEAVYDIWMEAIETKQLRWIGARGYFIDTYPQLYQKIENKMRQTPDFKWKNITDPGVRGHKITKYPWAQTKYVFSGPKSPNVVWLFGDKMAISSWAGKEPTVFVSTNTQLIQTYSEYFEELWGGVK